MGKKFSLIMLAVLFGTLIFGSSQFAPIVSAQESTRQPLINYTFNEGDVNEDLTVANKGSKAAAGNALIVKPSQNSSYTLTNGGLELRNSYIRLPNDMFDGVSSFTFSMSILLREDVDDIGIFLFGTDKSGAVNAELGINVDNGNRFEASINGHYGTKNFVNEYWDAYSDISYGEYNSYVLTMVYDASTNMQQLYCNGELTQEISLTDNKKLMVKPEDLNKNTIGRFFWDRKSWQGEKLDNVVLYDYVMTEQEISDLASANIIQPTHQELVDIVNKNANVYSVTLPISSKALFVDGALMEDYVTKAEAFEALALKEDLTLGEINESLDNLKSIVTSGNLTLTKQSFGGYSLLGNSQYSLERSAIPSDFPADVELVQATDMSTTFLKGEWIVSFGLKGINGWSDKGGSYLGIDLMNESSKLMTIRPVVLPKDSTSNTTYKADYFVYGSGKATAQGVSSDFNITSDLRVTIAKKISGDKSVISWVFEQDSLGKRKSYSIQLDNTDDVRLAIYGNNLGYQLNKFALMGEADNEFANNEGEFYVSPSVKEQVNLTEGGFVFQPTSSAMRSIITETQSFLGADSVLAKFRLSLNSVANGTKMRIYIADHNGVNNDYVEIGTSNGVQNLSFYAYRKNSGGLIKAVPLRTLAANKEFELTLLRNKTLSGFVRYEILITDGEYLIAEPIQADTYDWGTYRFAYAANTGIELVERNIFPFSVFDNVKAKSDYTTNSWNAFLRLMHAAGVPATDSGYSFDIVSLAFMEDSQLNNLADKVKKAQEVLQITLIKEIAPLAEIAIKVGANLRLPNHVRATFDNGNTKLMEIEWKSQVDVNVPGESIVTGTITDNDGSKHYVSAKVVIIGGGTSEPEPKKGGLGALGIAAICVGSGAVLAGGVTAAVVITNKRKTKA